MKQRDIFFRGFYKAPRGVKADSSNTLMYPRINVYGISLRGPVGSGLGNIETGYYHSPDDSDGTNRLIENSSFKTMAGYEKDLGNDLSMGCQYLIEQMIHFNEFKISMGNSNLMRDELRQLATIRLTKRMYKQTLLLSCFVFYSPTDEDAYIRPSMDYDLNDHVSISLGGNIMWGIDDYTEFGQMKRNDNAYTRIRYSF
ncbi:MAG: hypothetical protein ABII23_00985 [bacterium]